MNSSVKKVAVGQPIEKLLKKNPLLQVDAVAINDSWSRLQELRMQYIQGPQGGKKVFKLPEHKK